jgi:hypothetical protein
MGRIYVRDLVPTNVPNRHAKFLVEFGRKMPCGESSERLFAITVPGACKIESWMLVKRKTYRRRIPGSFKTSLVFGNAGIANKLSHFGNYSTIRKHGSIKSS